MAYKVVDEYGHEFYLSDHWKFVKSFPDVPEDGSYNRLWFRDAYGQMFVQFQDENGDYHVLYYDPEAGFPWFYPFGPGTDYPNVDVMDRISQAQEAPEPTAERANDDIPTNLSDFANEQYWKNFKSQDAEKAEDSPIDERDLTTWEQVKSQQAQKAQDSPIAEEAAEAALSGIDPDSVLSSGYLGPHHPRYGK